MQNYNYSKGSTLLLAMVIISTVLFAGIGVGTILSRQIKEIATIESSAVAFYVAETVAEAIFLEKEGFNETEEFVVLDWSVMGLDKDVAYRAKKISEGEYYVTVKVGSNYYSFIKIVSASVVGGDHSTIYYKNPLWLNVSMYYATYDQENSGGTIIDNWRTENMTESLEYPTWKKNEIIEIGEGAKRIRAAFCVTGTSPCVTDAEYNINFNDVIKACKQAGDCFTPKAFVLYNPESHSLTIYYKNPLWLNVSMYYATYDQENSGGTIIDNWRTENMTESLEYPTWKKNEIIEIGEGAKRIRAAFCVTGTSPCVTDAEYNINFNDVIKACKHAGDCFTPKAVLFY